MCPRSALVPIAAALLLATSNAFARIGETENEIEARYGKPIVADTEDFRGHRLILFRTNGMEIGVAFRDGKSAMEIYSNQDKSHISANEIQLLLGANAAGGKWTKSEYVPMWNLSSEDRVALLTADGRKFSVCLKDYVEVSKAAGEKDEKEKLKGF
jgi:hypothetical protein